MSSKLCIPHLNDRNDHFKEKSRDGGKKERKQTIHFKTLYMEMASDLEIHITIWEK